MKALRVQSGSLTLDPAAPEPTLAPGEALIRPTLVGLSPADLPAPGETRAWTPGRECVAVVESFHESVRPEDQARWAGKRVVVAPVVACGACDLCRGGLAAHCRVRALIGSVQREGCLAERAAIPLANLALVPDHLSGDQAVLALPVAAALHAARVARVEPAAFVTVLGDSLLALLTAQVLKRTYAGLRLLGSDPARLALCEKWGVRRRPLAEAGHRRDQSLVIECTGAAAGLVAAFNMLRPRGKLVLTAPLSGDLAPAVAGEIEIAGASGAPVAEGLAALARGDFETAGLITRRARLEAVPAALRTLRDQVAMVVEIDG